MRFLHFVMNDPVAGASFGIIVGCILVGIGMLVSDFCERMKEQK